jgi:hypothetical protein
VAQLRNSWTQSPLEVVVHALIAALAAVHLATRPAHAPRDSTRDRVAQSSRSDSGRALIFWLGGTARVPAVRYYDGNASAPRRTMIVTGVTYSVPLRRAGRVSIAYTPTLLPVVWLTGNVRPGPAVACGVFELCPTGRRYSTGGVGILPAALHVGAAVTRRLSVAVGADGGLVRFSGPVPTPDGERLNFYADALTGVRWQVTRAASVGGGYRFVHISNGGRGDVNPGINAHLVALGVVLAR